MRRGRALPAACVLAALGTAASASAQPLDCPKRTRLVATLGAAEEVTPRRGLEGQLDRAYRANPSFALLREQAKALADAGLHAAALRRLQVHRRCAGRGPEAAHYATVERDATRLWAQTARVLLRLRIASGSGPVDIMVDGDPVGRWPIGALLVDPGRHQLALQSPSWAVRRALDLQAGRDHEVRVVFRAPAPDAAEQEAYALRSGLHLHLAAAPTLWLSTLGRGSTHHIGGAVMASANLGFASRWDARLGAFVAPGASGRGLLMPVGASSSIRYGGEPYGFAVGVAGGYLVAPTVPFDEAAGPADGPFVEPTLTPLSLRFGAFDTSVRAGLVLSRTNDPDTVFGPSMVRSSIWFGYLL